jgi:hypothetical protein
MLEVASVQLNLCKDLALTLVELFRNRRAIFVCNNAALESDSRAGIKGGQLLNFTPPYDESEHSRAMNRLDAVSDDILHVDGLKALFCSLTKEVSILPCLRSRFSHDVMACESWWTVIRTSQFNW